MLVWHPRAAPYKVAAAPRPTSQMGVPTTVASANVERRPIGEADRSASTDTPSVLLQRWAASVKNRNLDAQLACYAPNLYAFYGARDVSADVVRQRRSAAMARYSEVRRFDISDLDIQMKTPTAAVATFNETWDVRGPSPSRGKVQERLGMRRIAGGWRITSESNIRTFYRSGQNPQS